MKTVCVVGLGPAGITAVKELREKGFEVTGYDAGKRIGGRWALDWENYSHGAWEELCTNQARHINEFSDFPWRKQDYANNNNDDDDNNKDNRIHEDRYGYYPHSTEVYHYLKAYADHFRIMDSMVLNTKVLKIERTTEEEWIVRTRNTHTNQIDEKTFQFLVMAQGRYYHGHNPLVEPGGPLEGCCSEEKQIIHSARFRSVRMAENKRVLVIGSSVSGCDIVGSIVRDGKALSVDHSVRHVPYVLNHLTDRGAITDEVMFSRLIIWLTTYLPTTISNKGLQAAIGKEFSTQVGATTTNDDDDNNLVPPDPDIVKAGVSYAYDWVETLHKRRFNLKPAIRLPSTDDSSDDHSHQEEKKTKTITFEDGSTGDYDLIVCATGYSMDLSLLPQDLVDEIRFVHPFYQQTEVALYKWTLVPDTPTLAFCGAANLIGAPFPCFEMNSRWIANVFAADVANDTTALAKRPSKKEILKGVNEFKAHRTSSPAHKYDMAVAVTETMADEMGLAPSKLRTLFWNPSKLLFSYPYASYYRTDPNNRNPPETVVKARERFEYLVHNVPIGIDS